jgi:hypothetical protein
VSKPTEEIKMMISEDLTPENVLSMLLKDEN